MENLIFTILEQEFYQDFMIYLVKVSIKGKERFETSFTVRRIYDTNTIKINDYEHKELHVHIKEFIKNHIASMNVTGMAGMD